MLRLKFAQAKFKISKTSSKILRNLFLAQQKSGKYCFSSDDGKYFNHSKNPNSYSTYYEDEVVTKAIRDIQKGEDITDDYSSFEKDFNEHWPKDK
mgnify:CR=1 FL=1